MRDSAKKPHTERDRERESETIDRRQQRGPSLTGAEINEGQLNV